MAILILAYCPNLNPWSLQICKKKKKKMYLKNKAIAVLINQFQLPVNVLDLLEKLDGSCVTHRLHLSLLMCCHTAAASDVRNE